ncbi:MAG: VWA domain-containing protein [Candidatus Stygibacter frigidus]|nr:VWA domain-containing protein [Candidatus Stygibacter frigidus]
MRAKILFFLILGIGLLALSSCTEKLEYTPRAASFSDFYPVDGTSGIEPFISLYWSCEFATYYQLYFGTNPDSLEMIEENLIVTEKVIDVLALGTTYYWKVVAFNGAEIPEYGPLLSFSTRNGEWGEFYPENGADSLSLSLVLNWGMSRSDIDKFHNGEQNAETAIVTREDPTLIYYDLYLGTNTDSLDMLVENTELQYAQVSDLFYNTEYYWQVKARNYVNELAASPILSFSTRQPEWEVISPANAADDQETNLLLEWSIDGISRNDHKKIEKSKSKTAIRTGEYEYAIYLGASAYLLELVAVGLEEPNYELDSLNYLQEYSWQIKGTYQSNQELLSPVYKFETKDRFSDIHPGDNETSIEIDPVLSWSCIDAESYDLYRGSEGTGLNLIASEIRDTTYIFHNLTYETIYQWRIDALLSDGTTWQGPVMNFITIPDPVPPGYKLHNHLIRAEMPCNIDVVYRVTDRADNANTELVESDFRFLEDGEDIDAVESALHIYTGTDLNTINKTVLMIDNSTSMDSLLDDIKLAAYDLVENLQGNQYMCVYTFSEQAELIEDFTNNQADLVGAINSIQMGYPSTDLYGSVITGVNHWEDVYYPENLIKGNLIIITDGSDTQGSSTLQEALDERGNKHIYTLGIGSDIDIDALSALGNEGFFVLNNVSEVAATLLIIQKEISDYLNSFYWLNYITPKRGDIDHTIEISVIANPNTGISGIISGTFNSAGFYGTVPGVYVNIDPENGLPYGIEEYTIADSASHVLEAVTYNAAFEPEYEWEVDDPSIVELLLINAEAHTLVIRRGVETGTTEITVRDIINDHQRVIDIIVE